MNRIKQRLMGGALAALGLAGVGLWYAARIERAAITLDRFTVPIRKPGLPAEGLTILHLSDFHFRGNDETEARKVARLKELLEDEPYDVLAVTGDLIHDWRGLPAALDLIAGLHPARAAFYCPGNHDYVEYSMLGVTPRGLPSYIRKVLRNEMVRMPIAFNDMPALLAKLEACGVQPLVNRSVRLSTDGGAVWFAGIDDAVEGRPDLAAALADVPQATPTVLLAHNPDAWLDPRAARADLILSGHTHGGQIRLPLFGAAHTQGTHLTRQQAAGWFRREGTTMFVSRGLGESIPLRFGVRPQAALIRLEMSDEK